jgi:general stress protein YciG
MARGFAAMSLEKRRAIAALGGKAVSKEKRSFSRDNKLAQEAGRRGGLSVPPEKRTFSVNPKLAATSGRKGGEAKKRKIVDESLI